MTRQMSESSAVARLATDVFAPAAFEYLFWRPRHLVDAPAVAHLPLLFWICSALRPKEVAVVGAGDGVVHFALCQAMDRMSGQGRCSGYGFWKDAASGGFTSTVPQKLASHQEMLYEEISRLVPSQDPDIVVDGLGPAALDLLWLDITAAPTGLIQRAELFSRSLKQSGVMFVHGIGTLPHDGADAAALKRLLNSQRCVRFDDEKGLLLVVLDGDVPTRIGALEAAAERGVLAPEVERVFRRIGQGLLSSVRATDALEARINSETRTSEATQARETAENSLKELSSAYDLRNRKVAELQSELFDTQILFSDLKAQVVANDAERVAERLGHEVVLTELKRQRAASDDARLALEAAHQRALEKSDRQRDALSAEAEGLHDQLKAMESHHALVETKHRTDLAEAEKEKQSLSEELQSERSARFAETAALTRIAEDLRKEVEALTARNAELTTNLAATRNLAKQTEANLKADIANERRTRFRESATLTRMFEDLKAENDTKKRRLEAWLVEKLVQSERKLKKYRRDRKAFFSDSRSSFARAYFRLRTGA